MRSLIRSPSETFCLPLILPLFTSLHHRKKKRMLTFMEGSLINCMCKGYTAKFYNSCGCEMFMQRKHCFSILTRLSNTTFVKTLWYMKSLFQLCISFISLSKNLATQYDSFVDSVVLLCSHYVYPRIKIHKFIHGMHKCSKLIWLHRGDQYSTERIISIKSFHCVLREPDILNMHNICVERSGNFRSPKM